MSRRERRYYQNALEYGDTANLPYDNPVKLYLISKSKKEGYGILYLLLLPFFFSFFFLGKERRKYRLAGRTNFFLVVFSFFLFVLFKTASSCRKCHSGAARGYDSEGGRRRQEKRRRVLERFRRLILRGVRVWHPTICAGLLKTSERFPTGIKYERTECTDQKNSQDYHQTERVRCDSNSVRDEVRSHFSTRVHHHGI